MLENIHGPFKGSITKHDENSYTLGNIAGHNIVLACLPTYGTTNAAVAGKSMQNTFPNLRFGLIVGVGGGIPTESDDIRLGDIAVSMPNGQNGGVIEYDMGKEEDGGFRCAGSLNRPPTLLLTAIATLRAKRGLEKNLTEIVNTAFKDDPDEGEEWRLPITAIDRLCEVDSARIERVIEREPRRTKNPKCF